MSETTRAERASKLAAIDAEIDVLEEKIEALRDSKSEISETEEDRQWRLDNMTPWEKQMVDLLKLTYHLLGSIDRQFTEEFSLPAKIGTSLRIRLPK